MKNFRILHPPSCLMCLLHKLAAVPNPNMLEPIKIKIKREKQQNHQLKFHSRQFLEIIVENKRGGYDFTIANIDIIRLVWTAKPEILYV